MITYRNSQPPFVKIMNPSKVRSHSSLSSRAKAILLAVLPVLFSSFAQADIYIGSQNNSGIIYQYTSGGVLLGTTGPSFSAGAVGALSVQAGTGNIVASTGGTLALLNADLSNPQIIGNGFAAFTSIASQSSGTLLTASVHGPGGLAYWTPSGNYGGGFGNGFVDGNIAVGVGDSIFVTYLNAGTYSLARFGSAYGYQGTFANDVGSSIVTNAVTGQIWTSGNSAGQLLLFDTAGSLIGAVGNGFADGIIAASSNGKIWMASSYSGGSLSAWGSDGSYLGTFQSGLGSISALAVDPLSGRVYVGLADESGGSVNSYLDDGTYAGTFGSGLGITSIVATVPEPSTVLLLIACGFALVWPKLRKGLGGSLLKS